MGAKQILRGGRDFVRLPPTLGGKHFFLAVLFFVEGPWEFIGGVFLGGGREVLHPKKGFGGGVFGGIFFFSTRFFVPHPMFLI